MGEDLGARERELRVGDRYLTRERIRRIIFGVLLFLVVLFAVTLLLQAVQDNPDDQIGTVTEEG
jgi:Trk-type K+ transport system membrane component